MIYNIYRSIIFFINISSLTGQVIKFQSETKWNNIFLLKMLTTFYLLNILTFLWQVFFIIHYQTRLPRQYSPVKGDLIPHAPVYVTI